MNAIRRVMADSRAAGLVGASVAGIIGMGLLIAFAVALIFWTTYALGGPQ